MNNISHEQAFKEFRKGNLELLSFIPNFNELYKEYNEELGGKCCARRRQAVNKYNQILGTALHEANQ